MNADLEGINNNSGKKTIETQYTKLINKNRSILPKPWTFSRI